MERFKLLLSCALLALAMGCAQHSRTVEDPGIDGSTMYNQLNGFLGGTDTSISIAQPGGSNTSTFQQWAMDPAASVYFSQEGALGPVASVASLSDFSAFGVPGGIGMVNDIQIFFVDDPASDGHHNGLLVAIQPFGQQGYVVSVFTSNGDPDASKDGFTTVLSGDTGTVILQSSDVDSNGNLNNVIQLQVSTVDSGGNQNQIGQFSTLVGFTQ